jgi:hypothetical protein
LTLGEYNMDRYTEQLIEHNIIPLEVFNNCVTEKDIERNSLYILGIYPSKYPEDEIYVEDLHKKINWSKIPYKHIFFIL